MGQSGQKLEESSLQFVSHLEEEVFFFKLSIAFFEIIIAVVQDNLVHLLKCAANSNLLTTVEQALMDARSFRPLGRALMVYIYILYFNITEEVA